VDGILRTEDARALRGVTRALVLELWGRTPPPSFRPPRLAEAAAFQECFLTSVSRGVLPVVRLDDRRVGEGRPGAATLELRERLDTLAEREAEAV
jgi:branched-subunit amino acid aminotransferase/4-amino-4-deoxychorismate lyase